ncbi:multidrug effflux MFS transporter [Prauserella oleivorans]|uniref:Multidrug effflux MFS transporter n=1 Tax=Prauserella oleivorans TaxID=1478153 RepID=A0ABW5W5K7_9PSEU
MTAQTGTGRNATHPAAGSPSGLRRLRFAVILGGLTAFGPLSIDMYLPALPAMTDDLGAGNALVQVTLAAFVVGLGVGQLVASPLSDAFGRRRPLLVGVTIYTLASVLCAVSPTIEMLIAARTVQALGAATGVVIARAAVRDLFSGVAMARFFSALMLVSGLAPILAPVIGGQLLTLTSWRGIFLTLTVLGGLVLLVTAAALPETLPAASRRPARAGHIVRTYGELLRHRFFLGCALTVGLGFAMMFTYISGSSFVFQDVYGLSPQGYSLVFGAGAVCLVLATQVNARIVGRFSQRGLLLTALIASAAGAVVATAATALGLGLAAVLPALYVALAGYGMVMPNATALALSDHPDKAGSASALLGVLQFAIGGAASPVVGLFGESSAVPMAAMMATFALLALVSFMTVARRGRLAAG